MKKLYITLVLACSIVIGIFSIGAGEFKEGKDRSKDIIFSHKLHIKSAGMECADCHKEAPGSGGSKDNLLPKMETCGNCHDIKADCDKCHKDSKNAKPFANPERDYNYSHKAHLGLDSTIVCTTCHQGLDEVELSSAAPKALPNMELCFGCHNSGMDASGLEFAKVVNKKGFKASKSCDACHTDLSNLKPKTHYASDFKKQHANMARAGAFDKNCNACHTESFCQSCHNGTPLLPVKDVAANATSDKSTKMENYDDGKKMVVQNVHSLNYIVTHSHEARTKSTNCYACHNEKTFCNDCHSGNNDGIRKKPKWHTSTGFTTLGRGSGGGAHAKYAKREIETCASCHDTQGGDPVCLMCHTDADGVKGTDPKTHSRDFNSIGEDGLWHKDMGAVCFNCHTDINARSKNKGKGFCGYCHK